MKWIKNLIFDEKDSKNVHNGKRKFLEHFGMINMMINYEHCIIRALDY